MKTKIVLITILLALVTILLLQTQVKAEEIETPEAGGGEGNVSEYVDSNYDYFLTASNKILSKSELSDSANAEEEIVACIRGTLENPTSINLEREALDETGKIVDNVTQRICEFIPIDLFLSVPNNTIIPASIFAKLKTCDNTHLDIIDEGYDIFTFYSSGIENTNVDFKVGVEISSTLIGNMTALNDKGEVKYIKFKNETTSPGKVEISRGMGGGLEGEPDSTCYLEIEAFNENTKAYEYFDSVKDPYKTLSILGKGAVLYPQGGYAMYNVNETPLFIETEINSVTWTEEDINSVLKSIEETRNNTTGKYLFVKVPSGSKVPAKIFEASKDINITIKAEDGCRAEFSGGNYDAIDYVAGGFISKKPIEGMVSVGEENIIYLSLKHEGKLPSAARITCGPALGGDDVVKTKLYYFNEEAQKYELCGTGAMNLELEYYVFMIDHCSSYVMTEEELPKEFVLDSTTGDNNEQPKQEEEKKEEEKKEEVKQEQPKQEENKKEEPKKEETKKDETTAPGKIPYAGGTTVIILSTIIIAIVGTIAYIKNRELKGI